MLANPVGAAIDDTAGGAAATGATGATGAEGGAAARAARAARAAGCAVVDGAVVGSAANTGKGAAKGAAVGLGSCAAVEDAPANGIDFGLSQRLQNGLHISSPNVRNVTL